jgi:hypothetical protein
MLIRWDELNTIPDSSANIAVTGYKLYMDGGNDGNYILIYNGTY